MRYYTTRAFPTASRQYEAGDAIDPANITAAEWIKGTESGAVVPARWYGTAIELAARGIPGPGVPVYETDTKIARVGDGVTSVASLPQVGIDTYGPIVGSDAWLRVHAGGNLDALIVGAVTRDANGAATSAGVVWPDGSTGTYTATTVSSAFPGAVDAFTVTWVGATTKTVTQPAVTRDSSTGAVTTRPTMTVA